MFERKLIKLTLPRLVLKHHGMGVGFVEKSQVLKLIKLPAAQSIVVTLQAFRLEIENHFER